MKLEKINITDEVAKIAIPCTYDDYPTNRIFKIEGYPIGIKTIVQHSDNKIEKGNEIITVFVDVTIEETYKPVRIRLNDDPEFGTDYIDIVTAKGTAQDSEDNELDIDIVIDDFEPNLIY